MTTQRKLEDIGVSSNLMNIDLGEYRTRHCFDGLLGFYIDLKGNYEYPVNDDTIVVMLEDRKAFGAFLIHLLPTGWWLVTEECTGKPIRTCEYPSEVIECILDYRGV